MRYFLINGYLPYPYVLEAVGDKSVPHLSRHSSDTLEQRTERYRRHGLPPPSLGETTLFSEPKIGRIALLVFGNLHTALLVAARSQPKAYRLGKDLRAILTCIHGLEPPQYMDDFLFELKAKPTGKMTLQEMAKAIRRPAYWTNPGSRVLEIDLKSGIHLDAQELSEALVILKRSIGDWRLHQALRHLENSYSIVWGFMVGSYYESHYSWDRANFSNYDLHKLYYESQVEYELGFLSAFRGIEALLGKNHLRKPELRKLLLRIDEKYKTHFSKNPYKSYFEIFSSKIHHWQYHELLSKYLYLRNSVAAHANPKPPSQVSVDQVLELQHLLKHMFLVRNLGSDLHSLDFIVS